MTREVSLRDVLIGVEGLAVLRNLYHGPAGNTEQRIAEIRRILSDDEYAAGEPVTESDSVTGYRLWSVNYDEPGNQLIAMEQPAVWSLLDGRQPGDALDAACGTGRHTRRLVELGHRVTGVDLTPEMLAIAEKSVPAADFRVADLLALPFGDESFDLVVCGLALAHLPDLGAGIAELGRVLRPGGRLVTSQVHPFQAHLDWNAPFKDADGNRGFIREHRHGHADYVSAFTAAGLTVRACVEPAIGMAEIGAKRRAYRHIPDATIAAYLGLPAVLVWDAEKAPPKAS
ncbi:MAG TPA: methyltransferase domain-containing protein [Pseudonocardiaceae bacterium]|jgi:ubiquinone/menaquinone biosynthesis C-methylase UbiE